MERFDLLNQKVEELIGQVKALRRENEKLTSQIEFIEEENQRAKKLIYENTDLSKERVKIKEIIGSILTRLNELKI